MYTLVLIVFRVFYTKSGFYLFLVWNLFLAIIPYLISNFLNNNKQKYMFYLLLPIWLLFLPNAPYIITDFFHLQQGILMPIWFDLLLISSFAVSGMLLFFLSLNDMFIVIKIRFSNRISWIITVSALFLSGFGIYLGRYLRWNSWEIIQQPKQLFQDIINPILHPFNHPKTWGITFGFGLFFFIIFLGFRKMYDTSTS
jgi:uncharacterized membrane protein